jgi:hypothetical protein
MAQGFAIKITAVDSASKTITAINKNLAGIAKPVKDAQAAFSRFSKDTGLASVGRGISAIGQQAREIGSSLGIMNSGLGAVAGATSVAGVAALARQWGEMGIQTANAAANIGITGDKLRTMSAAAEIGGASAGGMATALTNVGNALNDAVSGRNNQVAALWDQLHLTIKRTADGSIDAVDALKQLAGVMPGFTTQSQQTIASILGVSDVLPLLRKGADGYAQIMAAAAAARPPIEGLTAKQEALGKSIRNLEQAGSSFADTLSDKFAPALTNVINKTADWVTRNKELLTTPVYKKEFWQGVFGGGNLRPFVP